MTLQKHSFAVHALVNVKDENRFSSTWIGKRVRKQACASVGHKSRAEGLTETTGQMETYSSCQAGLWRHSAGDEYTGGALQDPQYVTGEHGSINVVTN